MFRISIRLLYYLLICNIFKEPIAIVSIAAAKVRTFFKLTNFLEENLKGFFRNPPGGRTSRLASLTSSFPITVTYFASCQSRPLSLECGCKSRTKISFMQMFGKVFYIFFSLKRRNIIWYAYARSDTAFFTITRCFFYFDPQNG